MLIKAVFDEQAALISMVVKDGTMLYDIHNIHNCATTGRHVTCLNSKMSDVCLPGCTSTPDAAAVNPVKRDLPLQCDCPCKLTSWFAGTGLGLAVALGASNTLETLTVNQYFHILFRVALHLKARLSF